MAFHYNVYQFSRSVTNPTAVTQLQIATAATKPIVILRAWVGQSLASPSSAGAVVQLNRATVAGTVTAAVAADIVKLNPSDAASSVQLGTGLTGYTATVEPSGTVDLLYRDGWNALNGWLYLPVPEERIVIAAGSFFALKFLLAPPAATYYVGVTLGEIG